MDPRILAAIPGITKQAYEDKRKRMLVSPIPPWDSLNGAQQTLEVDATNFIIQQYDLLTRGFSATPTESASTRETR